MTGKQTDVETETLRVVLLHVIAGLSAHDRAAAEMIQASLRAHGHFAKSSGDTDFSDCLQAFIGDLAELVEIARPTGAAKGLARVMPLAANSPVKPH